jgi:Spy/CpxP family protein refolding chaperone
MTPMSCRRELFMMLAVAVAATGCAAKAANTPPPATAATLDDDAVAGLLEHHRYHHHGGVTLFIAMSLETLGVSPEQRDVVEKVRDNLHANMEAARKAEQVLVTTLADGLKASRFDGPRVDEAVVKVTVAASQVDAASADALNQLHATLTPQQRDALMDKVEAHWTVWKRANVGETEPADRAGSRLATLEADLTLTPEQETKIRAALADDLKSVPPMDQQRVSAHLRAFGDAFRAANFDARTMKTGQAADEQLVRWGAVHLVHMIESMSPVLTADQRAELADRLNGHGNHDADEKGSS